MSTKESRATDKILDSAKEIYHGSYLHDFIKPARDRFNHPFIFSFLCSFLIVNWDLLLYFLFSSDIIEVKIGRFYLNYNDAKNLLVKPFFLAILYTLGFPHVTNWFKRALLSSKKEDYKLQKDALIPEFDFKIEEAKKTKELQQTIAETEDISLLNKKVEDLEKSNMTKDVQFLEQKETLDNTIRELRESQNEISGLRLDLQNKDIELEDKIRDLNLRNSESKNEIISQFNKTFNILYDRSKFTSDLFQDSFSFERRLNERDIPIYINFMKDRMKYFGIFTNEILYDIQNNGTAKFDIYINYPNFSKNEASIQALKKMFLETKIGNE